MAAVSIGTGKTGVDFDIGARELAKVGRRAVVEIAALLNREMAVRIPVDTGTARAWLGSEWDEGSNHTRQFVGILAKNAGKGRNKGAQQDYPAMMDAGIKRHFVSFRNRDGSIRDAFVNWARRHGFSPYKSALTGKATKSARTSSKRDRASYVNEASGGLLVWGYARPWATGAFNAATGKAPGVLMRLRSSLGDPRNGGGDGS